MGVSCSKYIAFRPGPAGDSCACAVTARALGPPDGFRLRRNHASRTLFPAGTSAALPLTIKNRLALPLSSTVQAAGIRTFIRRRPGLSHTHVVAGCNCPRSGVAAFAIPLPFSSFPLHFLRVLSPPHNLLIFTPSFSHLMSANVDASLKL